MFDFFGLLVYLAHSKILYFDFEDSSAECNCLEHVLFNQKKNWREDRAHPQKGTEKIAKIAISNTKESTLTIQ